jgi:hypothetical protein
MYSLALRSLWPLAAGPLGLLLALVVWAGPVRAQQAPSRELTTEEYAREIQKQLKQVEEHDCTSKQAAHFFVGWVVFVVLAVVIVSVAVAFKVGIWLLSRMSATTDPQQLLMSDPWMRAHLAQQKAGSGLLTPPPGAPVPPGQ